MGGPSSDDFVSDINVTPLVDVMLVLLIIFMVTAPMMTEGLEVNLPRVEVSETLPAENEHVMLTVREDGSVFLDEYETSAEDLPSLLDVHVVAPGRRLFIRADQHVPYGIFMNIMGKIRRAGIHDVGLVTLPAEGTGEKGSGLENAGGQDA
ncbi:ExbD/TolR family protein [Mailhella massiliensis]|uniref:ExbD/TolR family protein n=1 Tax=Mailhella massiliensis TaxID=1903261 RepID=A0A921AV05_9BACT|nr:ExbD/TolR family protein [Mailhella massiliensis]HJD96359.1 ExbD/TolR family protein [Mailhella massiliensis]